MKKSVFPEGVKGPVHGFEIFGTAAIINEAVRARLAKGFSCVASSVQNVDCLFRRFAVHGVRAYFVCKHNFGLKNFAPLKIFKRKKGKKESAPTVWKENAMQYFFRKILGLNFSATKLFLKNRLRLDIVGAFA